MDIAVTVLVGTVIGIVMGVTGSGGGVLTVPALLFGLQLSMQQAAPMAMVAVAVAATIGTIEGLLRGVVRYRAAVVIALAGAPCAVAGVALARQAPDLLLRGLFVAVLSFVAWRQWTAVRQSALAGGYVAEINPATGRFVWTARAGAGFCGIGAVTGVLSGLLGVGGGFVLVPLLSRLSALDRASLVATSLMVTALVTSVGAVSAAVQGVPVRWSMALWLAVAMALGVVAGRVWSRRLPDDAMRRAFAAMVATVALLMAVDSAYRWWRTAATPNAVANPPAATAPPAASAPVRH